MSATSGLLLVADVGGTHARFALAQARGGTCEIDRPTVLETADHPTLESALAAFLDDAGRPRLDAVAVCAAGPVEGAGATAHIRLTNCPWEISAAALAVATGVERPLLVNDFAALAGAVPALTRRDLHPLGGGARVAAAPIAVLGAGTGLGVAALVPDGRGGAIVVPGEGGHADLAPTGERELAILAHLAARYGHVSIERVLSGPGLVAIFETLAALDDIPLDARPSGIGISDMARARTSALAVEAVSLFCGWLGSVAGNLALTLGARGGVFIGGGIVPGWIAEGPGLFDEARFRRHFEAKGRFAAYLVEVPAYAIMRPDAALLGLAHAALEEGR